MKIKPEHFSHMKAEIAKVLEGNPHKASEYEKGKFPRSGKVKDLQRRFCFDLLNEAGLNKWICDSLYSYVNDAHIYTALKAICPKVTCNY